MLFPTPMQNRPAPIPDDEVTWVALGSRKRPYDLVYSVRVYASQCKLTRRGEQSRRVPQRKDAPGVT
jgi:hypothetical protein